MHQYDIESKRKAKERRQSNEKLKSGMKAMFGPSFLNHVCEL